MKTKLLCIFLNVPIFCSYSQNPITNGSDWVVTNLTANHALDYPNTMLYGPDDALWITERKGKKVVRVITADGTKSTMLNLGTLVHQTGGQDGLMGMAVHPALYENIHTTTNNYVFLAYTYFTSSRKLRISRYTYDHHTATLIGGSAMTILEGLDASNDHNSGKLIIGPDLKLYYTIGDQGANQFANACNEIIAQYLPTSSSDHSDYKGKILRMDLDGSIPSDNPILNGVQSHVYTYGHRNPQGIVFSEDGILYASEHGPKVDDELNIIEAGKNYGWPLIAGYYDNNGYGYCNWSSTPGGCSSNGFSDHNCPNGVLKVSEFSSGMPPDFKNPIGTFNSTSVTEPAGNWLSWPTVGPSSIALYEGGLIPDWGTSLLIPTLKKGTIYRTQLNASGDALENGTYEEFHSSNDRYRDVVSAPDGVTFYAITDNSGGTSGPSGTTGVTIQNPGVVMKIQYVGTTLHTPQVSDNDRVSIFPNPAQHQFSLRFDPSQISSVNLSIIDVQGRTVQQLKNLHDAFVVAIGTLSDGLYFIHIHDQNNKLLTIKKLIVQQ